nr:MAG TPA: hypothetical protein [Crassvirales sp.]
MLMMNVIKVLLMVAVCVTILAFALKKDYTIFNAKTLFWIKVGGILLNVLFGTILFIYS